MAERFTLEAQMIGGAGLAILRHWGFDAALVRNELADIADLLRANETAAPLEVEAVGVEAGYAGWAAVYDEPGNPIVSIEQPAVWKMLDAYPIGDALDAAWDRATRQESSGARPPCSGH